MSASARTSPSRVLPSTLPAGRRRPHGVVTPYDFRRPVKLSRENSRALQVAFETFGRQASTVMTSALRSVCQVELTSFDQQTYTEYVESLGDLTYMTVLSVAPIQQAAVLEMPLAVTLSCVDHLLGGRGSGEQPQRPLTDLESSVVANLFERLVAEVRYAFSSIAALEPRIVGVEYSPQLAQVANATDAMVVARFVLRHGDAEHPVSLCLSFAGLLPHLAAAEASGVVSDRERAQRAEASARLAETFQSVPVDVAVRFRSTAADPVTLANLRVGDVVRLGHPAAAPLDVTAADVVFAHATAGTQGRHLAALVVATPTQETR
ncbi:MAG: flagellar motor switch protein FliM [Nocardioidaceae bacterium]